MKNFLTIIWTLFLIGCGVRWSNSGQTTLDKSSDTQIAFRDHDSLFFFYAEPVENYRVSGVVSEYLNEWDYAPLELTFHNNKSHEEFTVRGGRLNWKYFLGIDSIQTDVVELHYPGVVKNGVISAPHNVPFFFADIDFDDEKELVTDYTAHAGTQRDVGRFTAIYKIIDGWPQDVTEAFTAKSEIFNNIDEYFFMVNTARKEILLYHDGGAINFGWEVYKFENGSYRYDRYVSCFNPRGDSVRVNILTPQRDTIKSFTVDKETFDREIY